MTRSFSQYEGLSEKGGKEAEARLGRAPDVELTVIETTSAAVHLRRAGQLSGFTGSCGHGGYSEAVGGEEGGGESESGAGVAFSEGGRGTAAGGAAVSSGRRGASVMRSGEPSTRRED